MLCSWCLFIAIDTLMKKTSFPWFLIHNFHYCNYCYCRFLIQYIVTKQIILFSFLVLHIFQNYYTYIYLFICKWVGTLMTLPRVKAREQLVWIISLFYHVDPDIVLLPSSLILSSFAYWTISLCQKLHFPKIHLK